MPKLSGVQPKLNWYDASSIDSLMNHKLYVLWTFQKIWIPKYTWLQSAE